MSFFLRVFVGILGNKRIPNVWELIIRGSGRFKVPEI